MEKIFTFFCINFDKVVNLVVKVNYLDKKVLYIGRVTNQTIFHFLNEMNWTDTFWDMWCDLAGSVGSRTCDISSFLHLEMYILLKPPLESAQWFQGYEQLIEWFSEQ